MLFAFVNQLLRAGCWRYQRRLSPYLDGELDQTMAARLERHLAGCAACRTQCEDLRFAARLVAGLPAPGAEPSMAPHWLRPEGKPQRLGRPRKIIFVLAPVAAVLAIAAVAVWYFNRAAGDSWEVARLSGRPMFGANSVDRTARLRAGEWLETDARSRALIHVGLLGQVEVDPRSRV